MALLPSSGFLKVDQAQTSLDVFLQLAAIQALACESVWLAMPMGSGLSHPANSATQAVDDLLLYRSPHAPVCACVCERLLSVCTSRLSCRLLSLVNVCSPCIMKMALHSIITDMQKSYTSRQCYVVVCTFELCAWVGPKGSWYC